MNTYPLKRSCKLSAMSPVPRIPQTRVGCKNSESPPIAPVFSYKGVVDVRDEMYLAALTTDALVLHSILWL